MYEDQTDDRPDMLLSDCAALWFDMCRVQECTRSVWVGSAFDVAYNAIALVANMAVAVAHLGVDAALLLMQCRDVRLSRLLS